jgi:hypothetical protein
VVSRAVGGIFQVISIESLTGIKLLQRFFQFHNISKRTGSLNEKTYLKMRFQ